MPRQLLINLHRIGGDADMAQKSPAFQFYVRDWILSPSVEEMTGDQVKGYLYLLSRAWLQEPRATLPNDMEKLASFACMTSQKWSENCHAIMANFKLDKKINRWVNLKLQSISKIQIKNFENGSKGGNPNFMKGKPNPYYQKDNPEHNPIP